LDSFKLPTLPVAYGPDRETKTTAPAVNAFDLEGLMEAFAGDALVNDQLREFFEPVGRGQCEEI
jgi:hypothetical protein